MSLLDLLCSPVPSIPQTALPAGTNYCVALIGSGGKTTLMSLLSRILPTLGCGVVTTTTTHIFPPNAPSLSPLTSDALLLAENLYALSLADALASFFQHAPCGHITVGQSISPNGKMRGLDPALLCQTMTQLCEKMTTSHKNPVCWIVEADGAAGLPLKAHAAHEPVIPACAHEIIMVAGLDALGQPLKDVTHRPELAVERLNSQLSPVTPETLVTPHLFVQQILAEIPQTSTPLSLILNKEDCLAPLTSVSPVLSLLPCDLRCYASQLVCQRVRRV